MKKANLINEIADTVADIPDAIKRQVYVDTVARQFGIEADIIQERVRKTREQKHLAASKERAFSSAENKADAPENARSSDAESKLDRPTKLSGDRILEPSERELLGFILRHGCNPLQFETDSEFFDPEGNQTVAEFIDAALSADNIRFCNPAYDATYQAYFALYDQGMEQEEILRCLLNGENRAVAEVVASLSTDKYELTVHNFSDALTTTDSWLVNFVPRAILVYHDKRLSARQDAINRELKAGTTPEKTLELMNTLTRLIEMKKTINIKLGRLKK